MEESEMKNKYNYWLSRYLKAEKFLEICTEEDYNKHLPLFYKVVRELSLLKQRFRLIAKREMTEKELEEIKNISIIA